MSSCVALLAGAARFVSAASTSPLWLDVVFIISTAIALTLGVALLGWRLTHTGRSELMLDEEDDRLASREGTRPSAPASTRGRDPE
ncbi:MAG: hypothetical protein R3B57_03445 [Phycisphaerales bacterium]